MEISYGISITETDIKSRVLCRGCIALVNRIYDFIVKVRGLQNIDEKSADYSVKRSVELSPSTCQPSKRTSGPRNSAGQLSTDVLHGPAIASKNSNQESHEAPIIVNEESTRFNDKQIEMILCALNEKDATVLATVLNDHCSDVVDVCQRHQRLTPQSLQTLRRLYFVRKLL